MAATRATQKAQADAAFRARQDATIIGTTRARNQSYAANVAAATRQAQAQAATTHAAATITVAASSSATVTEVRTGTRYSLVTGAHHNAKAVVNVSMQVTTVATVPATVTAPASTPLPTTTSPLPVSSSGPCPTSVACVVSSSYGDGGFLTEANNYRTANPFDLKAVKEVFVDATNGTGKCALQNVTTTVYGDCGGGGITCPELDGISPYGISCVDGSYAEGPTPAGQIEDHHDIMMDPTMGTVYIAIAYNPANKQYAIKTTWGL